MRSGNAIPIVRDDNFDKGADMSKKNAREDLDAYFAEANSWATDERENLITSRKIAWIIAAIAIAIAFFLAVSLIVLTPLKTVEPYTLMVDRQTGFVQQLKPIDPQLVSSEAALTQSFLVQYVIAREGFDINSLQSDYRKVALWSAEGARRSYLAAVPASNPSSKLATLPRSAIVDVHVKSVSTIGDNTSLVRFDTIRGDARGQSSSPRAWAAVVRYRYSGAPMTAEDRFVNPLGFQVVHYRPSEEVLSPSVATKPADASSDVTENNMDAGEPSVAGGQSEGHDEDQSGIRSQ
jgi:type IV secretion system protein VirB8